MPGRLETPWHSSLSKCWLQGNQISYQVCRKEHLLTHIHILKNEIKFSGHSDIYFEVAIQFIWVKDKYVFIFFNFTLLGIN